MRCFQKKNKVFPEDTSEKYKESEPEPEPEERLPASFFDKFGREVIYCGGCKTPFNLKSKELKIHCNICNQFFHCNIAGECIGKDCKFTKEDGTIHRARYCINCVKKIYHNQTCLCKDCYKN